MHAIISGSTDRLMLSSSTILFLLFFSFLLLFFSSAARDDLETTICMQPRASAAINSVILSWRYRVSARKDRAYASIKRNCYTLSSPPPPPAKGIDSDGGGGQERSVCVCVSWRLVNFQLHYGFAACKAWRSKRNS